MVCSTGNLPNRPGLVAQVASILMYLLYSQPVRNPESLYQKNLRIVKTTHDGDPLFHIDLDIDITTIRLGQS